MSAIQLVQSAQLWSLLLCLSAVGLAGFFGMMAWMAGAPLHTARRWLRWSMYPGILWALALLAGRLVT